MDLQRIKNIYAEKVDQENNTKSDYKQKLEDTNALIKSISDGIKSTVQLNRQVVSRMITDISDDDLQTAIEQQITADNKRSIVLDMYIYTGSIIVDECKSYYNYTGSILVDERKSYYNITYYNKSDNNFIICINDKEVGKQEILTYKTSIDIDKELPSDIYSNFISTLKSIRQDETDRNHLTMAVFEYSDSTVFIKTLKNRFIDFGCNAYHIEATEDTDRIKFTVYIENPLKNMDV